MKTLLILNIISLLIIILISFYFKNKLDKKDIAIKILKFKLEEKCNLLEDSLTIIDSTIIYVPETIIDKIHKYYDDVRWSFKLDEVEDEIDLE